MIEELIEKGIKHIWIRYAPKYDLYKMTFPYSNLDPVTGKTIKEMVDKVLTRI